MEWHLGYALACARDFERGIPLLEGAVRKAAADRCFAGQSMRMGWLAEALLFAQRVPQASKLAEEALAMAVSYGELPAQAHIRRIRGDIAAAEHPDDSSIVMQNYQEAEAIAGRLSMRPLRSGCKSFLAQRCP